MIAKISSSNSLATTLGYNFKKVEKHEASVLLVQGLFQDRNGRYSRAQVLADMLRTIPERCRTKKAGVSVQPSAVDINAGDIKRQVAAAVEHVLGRYAFQSVGEMNLLLTHFHVTAEEVKTERKGRPFDGIVYAATDTDGHKICTPIKASEIGRQVSYAALRRHFEQSKGVVRERSVVIRRAIADVMQTSPDRAAFVDRMRGRGIETVTRINAAGRLYGITFIDDANGIAVNGSRLGKGFAANVFNAYFAGEPNPFLEMSRPKEKEEQTAAVEELTESPNDMLPTEIDLSLQVHGADLREWAFQRRLRNRARVRLRRKPR